MDKIDEVIIDTCKIEDEGVRVKVVASMLKLKNSGQKFELLLAEIRRNIKW